MLQSNEARALIAKSVPWIKGKMLNYLTFERLVEEKLLPAARIVERGQDVFIKESVEELIKKFPKERPPNRIGIINWLKGERPKKPRRQKGKK